MKHGWSSWRSVGSPNRARPFFYFFHHIFLVFVLSTSGQAAQPQQSPSDLLQRAASRLLADMSHQPRYTCTQNVTRRFYRSDSKELQSCTDIVAGQAKRQYDPHLISWDHLQLEVAIANNREIHAWPDSGEFAEDEIRALVSNGGPFGSGDFAGFIISVFGKPSTIKFEAPSTVNGRTLFKYTFEVPQNASNYKITIAEQATVAGYGGSFLLDTQTADLVQLTLRTAELPVDMAACRAVSEIQYTRIDIHGNYVLVPRQTDLRTIYRGGQEAVGVTSYVGCREFHGTTKLRFDTTESDANKIPTSPVEPVCSTPPVVPFPDGLTFDCRIVTPIDSETPAGRPIEAILLSPLRGKEGVLAPIGARIHGRLVHLGEQKSRPNYFEVGVRLDSVEVNGHALRIYARAFRQAEPLGATSTSNLVMTLPRNVGVFFFAGKHLRLRPWNSTWITTSPEVPSGGTKASQEEPDVQTP
jgi:hypothetical protein